MSAVKLENSNQFLFAEFGGVTNLENKIRLSFGAQVYAL
jgi:hypothetical protein